jgi:L-threonylcarbamoyladenylate synthase
MDEIKTKIIRVERDISKIKIAAEIIRNGGLVAFPTETVYGLGANALNENAVKKIFEAKKRPIDNPIIVHIARKSDVYKLTRNTPKITKKLIDKFWPGPLTLILRRSEIVPKITCGGLDTIAIRMPRNRIALALIKMSKLPIAAPSANLSGKPSPTSARHVINDLKGRIDVVIDGGRTEIGVESTVLDLTTKIPTILRPGGVTFEELKKVLKNVRVHKSIKKKVKLGVVKSPGMKYRHYAPNAKMIVIEGEKRKVREKILMLVSKYKRNGKRIGVMLTSKKFDCNAHVTKFLGKDLNSIAKNLFKILREIDKENIDLILVEGVKKKGLGLAIMNRLERAAGFNVIKV